MKKSRLAYLVMGFVAGTVYLVACGSSGVGDAIAEAIGNAIDVVYDNTSSGLTASNVQAAIDEVASDVTDLNSSSNHDLAEGVVGTWTFDTPFGLNNVNVDGKTLTLNADGTYSGDVFALDCTGGNYLLKNNMLVMECGTTAKWYPLALVDGKLYLGYGHATTYEGTKS